MTSPRTEGQEDRDYWNDKYDCESDVGGLEVEWCYCGASMEECGGCNGEEED